MIKKKHILIIGDNCSTLKPIEDLLFPHYNITSLTQKKHILNFIKSNPLDLILIDFDFAHSKHIEFIVNIKEQLYCNDTPIIILFNKPNTSFEAQCFEQGIADFIIKPFSEQTLIIKIKRYLDIIDYKKSLESMLEEKTKTILKLQDAMLLSLAELVECRDENTGGHIKRTGIYVKILAEELAKNSIYKNILTADFIKDINRSAPLHDIGKIGINDNILLKASSLNETEFEYIKKHAQLGGDTLQKIISEIENDINEDCFLYTAKDMAHYHHEKWDGTGYPTGLKGEEIPISARIMAIADVYDALTTSRPYKKAYSHEEAVNLIINGKNTMFDPKIIDIFEKIHFKFKEEYLNLNK